MWMREENVNIVRPEWKNDRMKEKEKRKTEKAEGKSCIWRKSDISIYRLNTGRLDNLVNEWNRY